MQGLTINSLKKNPYLIPLYGCFIFGFGASIVSLGRPALKGPDVSWNKKKNPEPWQEYANKRYKLYDPVPSTGFTERIERPASFWSLIYNPKMGKKYFYENESLKM